VAVQVGIQEPGDKAVVTPAPQYFIVQPQVLAVAVVAALALMPVVCNMAVAVAEPAFMVQAQTGRQVLLAQ
jgi:hypothetical protein